jgi:hypothetical protein
MSLSILLARMAALCWSTPCTIAAAQTQCASFSDTIDGVNKDRAVEKSLKSLAEQIEKWKADNGVTGPDPFGEAPFHLMHYFHPMS